MGTARKMTVEVPPELLERAQQANGTGVTRTVPDYSWLRRRMPARGYATFEQSSFHAHAS